MKGRSLALVLAVAAAGGCSSSSSELWPLGAQPPDQVEENPPVVEEDFPMQARGPQPDFGALRSHAGTPALSGGTLIATNDKARLVAADPDRDRVFVVSLSDKKVTAIDLTAHDEPGRLVEDADGRVHVALRRGGAVATIDPATGKLLARRSACPAPRGITFDAARSRLLVACEGGELVSVDPDPAGPWSVLAKLDRDLRDVLVNGDTIAVSRFRTAELLELTATGTLTRTTTTRPVPDEQLAAATLAWRMIADATGAPLLVHQMASTTAVRISAPSGYGQPPQTTTGCSGGGIVRSVIRGSDGFPLALPDHAVLPLDAALDGSKVAIVAAGNAHTKQLPQVFVVDRATGGCSSSTDALSPLGQVTSIVTLGAGHYAVFSREPAQVQLLPSGEVVSLAQDSVEDTGHAIFHSNTGAGIACASCHGEGGDDAHVWNFDTIGARRTPSLRGTIAGTAPYHWDGAESDIAALAQDVLVNRMSGPSLSTDRSGALRDWLFGIPAPTPTSLVDAAAATRGKAIFERADVKCASCHAGAQLTTPDSVDVGTGGLFQVPSLLGVGLRAPLLHDGCAANLEQRFTSCGSRLHGDTTKLSAADLADLIAYLGSL